MTVRTVRNFVGGEFVEAGEAGCYDKVNPVDGCTAALVYEADAAVVDRAVRAARAALDGQWGRATADQRAGLLRRVADRIEDRFEEFVLAEGADTGKPLRQVRDLDVPRAVANFRSFADTVTGQVVLAGSATPAVPLTAAVVEAHIAGFGSVSVRGTP